MEEERCAENYGDGNSSSTSSCVSEGQEAHDDPQILRLLDAMDHLLSSRDLLSKSLSQGWMDIVSARYSMGPSRINQAIYSLKPCWASTLVSVSRKDDFVEDDGLGEEGDQVCDSQQEFQFALQGPQKNGTSKNTNFGNQSAKPEASLQSHLRQRHTSGMDNVQDDSEGSDLLDDEGDMSKDVHNKSEGSDPLAWFGTLVSPHLRVAQTSFREALETLVELATAQSTLLKAYQQIQKSDGLV